MDEKVKTFLNIQIQKSTERFDLKVLGIVIGTFSGCDRTCDYSLQFYDFESKNATIIMSAWCIDIDYVTGIANAYSEDNEGEIYSVNMFDVLSQFKMEMIIDE